MMKTVYECIVSDETNLKQFSLEIKSYSPFLEIALFTIQQILNFLGWKGVICHIAPFVTNGV